MAALDTAALLLFLLYLGHGLRGAHGADVSLLVYIAFHQFVYGNGAAGGDFLSLGDLSHLLAVAIAATIASHRASHRFDHAAAVVLAFAASAQVAGLHEALGYSDGGAGTLHVIAATVLVVSAHLGHACDHTNSDSHFHTTLLLLGYIGLNGGDVDTSLIAAATSFIAGHLAGLNDPVTNLLIGLVAVGSGAAGYDAVWQTPLVALLGLGAHHLAGMAGVDDTTVQLHGGVGLFSLLYHIVHAAYSGGDIAGVAVCQIAGAAALCVSAGIVTAVVTVGLDKIGADKLLNGGGEEAEEEAAPGEV